MKTKKINEEQLTELFAFMRRKRVRYYDLQVELVDHFASAIEDIWREEPRVSFESAVERVYGKFPITGFWSLIDQQTQAIQKEAWRWVFRSWTTYFHWPKVLLSIAVLLAIRLLFYLPIPAEWLISIGFLLIFGCGIRTIYFSKKGMVKDGKRFLRLEATYGVIANVINVFNSWFYIYMIGSHDFTPLADWVAWLLAFFFTYSGFFMYILFFQLPKRVKEDLHRYFPRYV
ncbi:hypothetical protein [Flavilitoribacter nigricans]|uniref:Uncharacterized protein n=1 Tax=Flavilitoribacter nigricans (strain ATCC 23147 / DSM 23189 / NBRC 102662 / NCIMB 1420 / SS-2) TaxID=1122177 RepID=A0A2D0NB72_FLAN2|nr:hypothetical protein [Flavilitoribacter nigricans]PHN05419.1 hypothetical protein CRP01_15590 [Flavilitoribacter nigricans DSM 23189 = NBRC 102662]